jgi:hypothetical protein
VAFKAGSDHEPNNYNSTFYAPPGDYSSESRFLRLAMLNAVAGLRDWPLNDTYSPNGTYAGPYPSKVSHRSTHPKTCGVSKKIVMRMLKGSRRAARLSA